MTQGNKAYATIGAHDGDGLFKTLEGTTLWCTYFYPSLSRQEAIQVNYLDPAAKSVEDAIKATVRADIGDSAVDVIIIPWGN